MRSSQICVSNIPMPFSASPSNSAIVDFNSRVTTVHLRRGPIGRLNISGESGANPDTGLLKDDGSFNLCDKNHPRHFRSYIKYLGQSGLSHCRLLTPKVIQTTSTIIENLTKSSSVSSLVSSINSVDLPFCSLFRFIMRTKF